jgi:hypothetical protein
MYDPKFPEEGAKCSACVLGPIVRDHRHWASESGDDVLVESLSDRTGGSFSDSSVLHPLGEPVLHDDDVAVASAGAGKRAHQVGADSLPWLPWRDLQNCATMNCQGNVNSTLPTQLPHKCSYIVAILGHNHFESPNTCHRLRYK